MKNTKAKLNKGRRLNRKILEKFIILICFFIFFVMSGILNVFISPLLFPNTIAQDELPNQLPDTNRPYVQKFHYNILTSFGFSKTIVKNYLVLCKLDCMISYETPKPNNSLQIIFNLNLDSYDYNSLSRDYLIYWIEFVNISFTIQSDNITETFPIPNQYYDPVNFNSPREFGLNVFIPENWNISENKFLSCEMDGLRISTDKGMFNEDLFPDFGMFSYYYFFEGSMYNESFNNDYNYRDIGTAGILLEYPLLKPGLVESLILTVIIVVTLLAIAIFSIDWVTIDKKHEFEDFKFNRDEISRNTYYLYSRIVRKNTIWSFITMIFLVFLVLSNFIGFVLFPRSFLSSFMFFNIIITIVAYIGYLMSILNKRKTKMEIINSFKKELEMERMLLSIESMYSKKIKNEIITIIATILVIYLMFTGKGDIIPIIS